MRKIQKMGKTYIWIKSPFWTNTHKHISYKTDHIYKKTAYLCSPNQIKSLFAYLNTKTPKSLFTYGRKNNNKIIERTKTVFANKIYIDINPKNTRIKTTKYYIYVQKQQKRVSGFHDSFSCTIPSALHNEPRTRRKAAEVRPPPRPAPGDNGAHCLSPSSNAAGPRWSTADKMSLIAVEVRRTE